MLYNIRMVNRESVLRIFTIINRNIPRIMLGTRTFGLLCDFAANICKGKSRWNCQWRQPLPSWSRKCSSKKDVSSHRCHTGWWDGKPNIPRPLRMFWCETCNARRIEIHVNQWWNNVAYVLMPNTSRRRVNESSYLLIWKMRVHMEDACTYLSQILSMVCIKPTRKWMLDWGLPAAKRENPAYSYAVHKTIWRNEYEYEETHNQCSQQPTVTTYWKGLSAVFLNSNVKISYCQSRLPKKLNIAVSNLTGEEWTKAKPTIGWEHWLYTDPTDEKLCMMTSGEIHRHKHLSLAMGN